ncbi:DUF2188 domain-containing protein [Rhodococcus chondri]|uniref:DUF2188 domain-containing protein n=1 Tax=Rhodococcus chondri TaxID=3065941 RepID=A0ABU7JV65_9NOCA|nr:DUF2188 domain-containing protein [Rhodococcus sp. CC-R104]MEE2033919.1 DUF2188 domain-containing protein [Rhodococcus sp. CC-R104]
MPTGDVETFHQDGSWHNRIEGQDGSTFGTHKTRDEAIREGREEARRRKVEHIIHNFDGTIGERNTYGQDPRNIKG